MMQKKKLKLLLASLAASTILFATPSSVIAADTSSGGTDDEVTAPDGTEVTDLSQLKAALTLSDIGDNPCSPGCVHVFIGTAAHTVQVTSGTHTIYLRGPVAITSDKDNLKDAPPLTISGTANVTLALEKGCQANFDGGNTAYAGIQVEDKAQLTIRGENGKLTATGGENGGAGIGGSSQAVNVGNITILSGNVTATGKLGGAGIGSGIGGGAANNISIKGGTVTATGGKGDTRGTGIDAIPPGPGIGSHLIGGNQSNPGNASGNVTLSGGTIYAYGGKYHDQNKYAGGIQAQNLSSDKGSTVIYTNDAKLPGVGNASSLNAIIWEQPQNSTGTAKTGTVWGDATLNTSLSGQVLELMTGSTLTIGSNITFDQYSAIKGDNSNKIIDVDKLNGAGSVQVPNRVVTLNETDFTEYEPFNENKEQTFSGTDKDFTDTILRHRETRTVATYGPLPVDSSKWNVPPVIKNGTAVTTKICNAGWYTVTYSHKEDSTRTLTLSNIHVAQRDLKDCEIKIADQIYTGKQQHPEVSITLNGTPLKVEDSDYTLEGWEKNIDVGDVSAKIYARNPSGNLIYISDGVENALTINYKIIGVPLTDAVVTIEPTSGTYNGSEHVLGKNFNIKVVLDGATLKEGTDYEIVSSEDADTTNAGDIIYSINGIKNYSGSKEAKYTITPKEITIKPDSMTAVSKDYDGTGEVTIEDVEFDGLVATDKGKVKLKSKGIVDANNEGHAGEYTSVHFEGDIELEYEDADGNRTPCTNYTVKYTPGEEFSLKEKVIINQVEPEVRKPSHVDPYAVNANGITFDCTIQIDRQPGVQYQFKMDGDPESEEGWVSEVNPQDKEKASAVFRGIQPAASDDDKHIFYARSVGTNDVIQVLMDTHEVVFKKLPNPKTPPKPTISYNEEGNLDKKTYTVTIDRIDESDIEYRVVVPGKEDGVEFSDNNTEPLASPGTKYIGQVRYKATEVYEASDPVSSDEIKTPASPLANSGPKYKYTWKRIIPNQSDNVEVPPGLQAVDYATMEEVTADLTRYLSQLSAYQDKDHTAFYDVKIQVITRDETGEAVTRDVLPGDFENGGIPVTLPSKQLPDGVVATENQFSAVHMFETDDYAEYSAGDIEICTDSDGAEAFVGSGKGVTFVVNGASPIGIAWSDAPDEPVVNPVDPVDPSDPATPTDPTNPQDPNAQSSNDANNPNNNNSDGQGNDAESLMEQLKSAIASLAPKTGDTNKIILWIVIAIAACIAVIAILRNKAKNGKKSAATAKKTASEAKKTTTAAKKSTTAAPKKTTTTAKKSTTPKKTTKKK